MPGANLQQRPAGLLFILVVSAQFDNVATLRLSTRWASKFASKPEAAWRRSSPHMRSMLQDAADEWQKNFWTDLERIKPLVQERLKRDKGLTVRARWIKPGATKAFSTVPKASSIGKASLKTRKKIVHFLRHGEGFHNVVQRQGQDLTMEDDPEFTLRDACLTGTGEAEALRLRESCKQIVRASPWNVLEGDLQTEAADVPESAKRDGNFDQFLLVTSPMYRATLTGLLAFGVVDATPAWKNDFLGFAGRALRGLVSCYGQSNLQRLRDMTEAAGTFSRTDVGKYVRVVARDECREVASPYTSESCAPPTELMKIFGSLVDYGGVQEDKRMLLKIADLAAEGMVAGAAGPEAVVPDASKLRGPDAYWQAVNPEPVMTAALRVAYFLSDYLYNLPRDDGIAVATHSGWLYVLVASVLDLDALSPMEQSEMCTVFRTGEMRTFELTFVEEELGR